MLLERDRHSPNGAVHSNSWKEIRQLEDDTHDLYVAYMRDAKEIIGEDYTARVRTRDELDTDIKAKIGLSRSGFHVEERNKFGVQSTAVFDMDSGEGIIRCRDEGVEEAEYYKEEADYWRFYGQTILKEVFEPGSNPELAEVAAQAKAELVNPDDLPARVMNREDYELSVAVARLKNFSLEHVGGLLKIYHKIAYPDQNYKPISADEQRQTFELIRTAESIGLRTGTKYLGCAKHMLDASDRDGHLRTSMNLNYNIPIGPVKLNFDADIDMAMLFGKIAKEYFSINELTP